MAAFCRCLLILSLLLGAAPRLEAATAEAHAFDAAAKELQDGIPDKAEAAFGEFVRKYPASPRLAEAVLAQAQARLRLGNYDGALALLRTHQAQAGVWADAFLLGEAEALLGQGAAAAAAEQFARVLHDFPQSTRCLEAALGEASAQAKLADWLKVVELLQQTNGVFQATARTNAANPAAVRGYLLLAEAQLAQGAAIAAEQALHPLADAHLSPEMAWQRQYLLCRILVAQGRAEGALQGTTNLLTFAANSGQRALQSESVAFQAGLFERLGRPDDAVAAYERNLVEDRSAERQSQALLKIIELRLGQQRAGDAAQVLERFLAQYADSTNAPLALLTLAELRLRQQADGTCTNLVSLLATNGPPATNCVQMALAALQTLTRRFPQSPLLGKAQLEVGWCHWLEAGLDQAQADPAQAAVHIGQAQIAFQAAAGLLPHSLDQATAYMKLGDTQYWQTNDSAAIGSYRALLQNFRDLPEARATLFEPALFQTIQAGTRGGHLEAATNALDQLLAEYPESTNADNAMLLTGQALALRSPAEARRRLISFVRAQPSCALRPELELALAHTYEQEDRWGEAIPEYEDWLKNYTNNAARPRAEFLRALANARAGYETNALQQFTNFVARFPTNEFAPRAQWWVATHFYNNGNYEAAEMNYKEIFLKHPDWAAFPLFYEARMMAGRSAYWRQDWKAAREHFGALANDTNRTDQLLAEAFFALGDTFISQSSTNKAADYHDALNAFSYVAKQYTNTAQATLAWGAMAQCLLQLAQGPLDFVNASNAFQQVIDAPAADVVARSIATVGLGITLEKLADTKPAAEKPATLEQALDEYLAVFYGKPSVLHEHEIPDPFWTKKAGLEAARLLEKLNRREPAANIYRRLHEMFPPLDFEDRIRTLQAAPAPLR